MILRLFLAVIITLTVVSFYSYQAFSITCSVDQIEAIVEDEKVCVRDTVIGLMEEDNAPCPIDTARATLNSGQYYCLSDDEIYGELEGSLIFEDPKDMRCPPPYVVDDRLYHNNMIHCVPEGDEEPVYSDYDVQFYKGIRNSDPQNPCVVGFLPDTEYNACVFNERPF